MIEAAVANPGVELLRELLSVAAPPGCEEAMAALVASKIREIGLHPEIDPAGNVLVRIPGRDPQAGSCILAAHLDEIAPVVTAIELDGRLCVERSGGLFPYKIGERSLQILGDEGTAIGVLSLGGGHGRSEADDLSWKQTRLLTGLSQEHLGRLGIRPGSAAVPLAEGRGPLLFGDPQDPLLAAWTLDDRLGVVALLLLLKSIADEDFRPHRSTIVAFTVHEEGGAHGAKVLAQRERPEIFIAVDGCPASLDCGLAMDGCPVAWSKDSKGCYDQRLIRVLKRAASDAGTKLQTAVLGPGIYTDATAVYDCGAAARVATVGHARENNHGFEVTRLSSLDNLVRTLVQLMRLSDWDGMPKPDSP